MTQAELAKDCGLSRRVLAALENERGQPDRATALLLAACLDVPLRERNAMLMAAGLEPAFRAGRLDAPESDALRCGVETMLTAQEPNPAMVIDRYWTVVCANRAVGHLLAGADPTLLHAPVNLLRVCLHPAGLAPRIVNLSIWRAHLIARLRRQIDATGDSALIGLLREMRNYPAPAEAETAAADVGDATPATPLRLATIDGTLTFLGLTTVIGGPLDITLAELRIETFLPADTHTGAIMRARLPPA